MLRKGLEEWQWCWGIRDEWGWESLGVDEVLEVGLRQHKRLRDGLLFGNNVGVASNNLLDYGMKGLVSNNTAFNMVLN